MITNLRMTLRRLLAHAGYASAVVLILTLAIGATGGVFSAVYAILLRPLPLVCVIRSSPRFDLLLQIRQFAQKGLIKSIPILGSQDSYSQPTHRVINHFSC